MVCASSDFSTTSTANACDLTIASGSADGAVAVSEGAATATYPVHVWNARNLRIEADRTTLRPIDGTCGQVYETAR